MANKKITAAQVSNVLGASENYFARDRTVDAQDPLEKTPMKLPIEQIKPYDRNPRKSKNPEYDTILASLRANTQEEALTITRRPGEDQYMIKRGGNTRLEIMSMFHQQGDARFDIVDCLFMPWTTEADCIVGHLNENTTQGRMTLIDKARGYRDFKLLYEQEHGSKLRNNKLAELLRENGATVRQQALTSMNYALDVLEPAIPQVLASGLGSAQVDKLRKLDQTFKRLADEHNLFDAKNREAQIKADFHHFLCEHEGEDWDMQIVEHNFVQHIGELFNHVSFNRIKLDINSCLNGNPATVELMSSQASSQPMELPISEQQDSDAKKAVQKVATTQPDPSTQDAQASDHQVVEQNQIASSEPVVSSGFSSTETEPLQPPEVTHQAGEFNLKNMRARIYTLALQFANSTHIDNCLQPWKFGYGYFLDIPNERFTEVMSAEQWDMPTEHKMMTRRYVKDRHQAQKSFAWWLLWQCQGILDFRTNQPLPGFYCMPQSSMRHRLTSMYNPEDTNVYKTANDALYDVWERIGGPRLSIDMGMAFSYVTPENQLKYARLLEARSQLMAYTDEHDIDLWGAQS